MVYTALITHRPEKPFGIGHNAHERASRIVGGFRAEVTDGLPDGVFCYTGVCDTREAVKIELVASLKALGYSGTLHFA